MILGTERVSLDARPDGWWGLDRHAEAGTDYSFSVDGAPPRPDPRSPWQPEGPDGPSRTVDHSTHRWTDDGWTGRALESEVIYELHVGTFTEEGTFDSAIGRLDHLVDLGVTAVELLPVAEFAGTRGWGYDGVDLYAPHHAYGGPDGLSRFVDACHSRGLAAIVDVVYNHLGPAGNYIREFGPYFTDRYATPWGDAINFDGPGSDGARAFFIDNALMWLRDYHFDGLRLDAVHAILDTSALHILEEIGAAVRSLEHDVGRRLWVIAESDLNDPRLITPVERGGYGLDAQWSDDFHHAMHALLTGETTGYYSDFGSVEHLAKALRNAFVYDGVYSPYRRRRHGRAPADLEGHRFLGYLQNHDQVGNRAAGDRSAALMTTGKLKIGAALVLMAPFVPMLFQGEEWGASTPFLYFTDHEPELGRLVSEGRKSEFAAFGWDPADVPDPQDPETFRRSKLAWDEVTKDPHAELLGWHKELIRFRRDHPPSAELADVRVRHDGSGDWLTFERSGVVVACNFSTEEVDVDVPDGTVALASSYEPKRTNGTVALPPESVTIYER